MSQSANENPMTAPGENLDRFPPSMMTGGAPQTYLDNSQGELSDGSTLKDAGYGDNAKFS